MIRRIVIGICLTALVACSQQQTTEQAPPLPADLDLQGLADQSQSKTDAITKWYMDVVGELAYQLVAGKTGDGTYFHGYTAKWDAGTSVALRAFGSYWGLVLVYKQKKNGSWGNPLSRFTISYDKKKQNYHGEGTFTATASGNYLVVVGSPWSWSYKYELGAECTAGSCVQKFCVEYVAADTAGNSFNAFYATTVDSYEAGKQLLAELNGQFIEEAINPGTCGEQSGICLLNYKPVCGAPFSDPEKTYGNLCSLKVAVRMLAKDGYAKGRWQDGPCRLPGQCFNDDECKSDDYCGDNGVRCIMAPCTANYNVCQPREDKGAYCDRNRVCKPGLHCDAEKQQCVADDAQTGCTSSKDCPVDQICQQVYCITTPCPALCGNPACTDDKQCGADGYCDATGVCKKTGFCVRSSDCVGQPLVSMLMCMGEWRCDKAANQCKYNCGYQTNFCQAETLEDQHYGACKMVMGYLWNGKECKLISGCGCDEATDPTCRRLFSSQQKCDAVAKSCQN